MAKAKKTINEQDVIHAGLQAMAARDSHKISLGDIAERLKTEEKSLYSFIQHPRDIFNLITRQTNRSLAKDYICDAHIPKRDQYFDLIMERLDLLAPYKTDMARFIKSLPQNPLTILHFFPDFERGITLMMRLAGDTSVQRSYPIKRLGLIWAYLSTLRVWIKDNSTDSAKTMAHLDKCLNRLDGLKDKTPFKKRPTT